jgi:predicted nucleotidyltransferase
VVEKKDSQFLDELIKSLKQIEGVVAIVLGGSRARGTHHAGSDFDLGLYYDPEFPPQIGQLLQVAQNFDDRKESNLLTSFGEWGPWINGGGWLTVQSMAVDLLYRDLTRVRSVFQECLNGEISISYQPGHPHGFVSSIYLAEVAQCQVLFDKKGVLSELKAKTSPYPIDLKRGTLSKFLWEADFSLKTAKKGMPYQDISYIVGSFYRAVSCLNQVIFAINEQYWMNEKGSVKFASGLRLCPAQFESRVNEVFSRLSPSREHLNHGYKVLSELVEEATALSV